MDYKPCNDQMIQESRNLLNQLATMRGKGILIGQHTQTVVQRELKTIFDLTGDLPALCGFELLAYSPNIDYENSSEACLKEVYENQNTLDKAWEWHEKGGLITFTWHWFSPLYGTDKAFYAEHTPFDAKLASLQGTPEYEAMIGDMDHMAGLLKPFLDQKVPILWRPFHESEGTWFWWGAKGPEVARDLYRIMYERFTKVHKLHNLIWVWNSPCPEGYVGDAYCDVISLDLYPPAYSEIQFEGDYERLRALTTSDKICALGEIGTIADVVGLKASRIPWAWFMIWSYPFIGTGDYNKEEAIKRQYACDYGITLSRYLESKPFMRS